MTRRTQQGLVALLSGSIFGAGLLISGMTEPRKVIAFLDFSGAWDPSLAFVMLGAIVVHFGAYRVIQGRAPLWGDAYALPTARRIDGQLVIGSAIFGVGWGLAGYCPGPAIVAFGSGSIQALIFVLALLLGMFGGGKLSARAVRS